VDPTGSAALPTGRALPQRGGGGLSQPRPAPRVQGRNGLKGYDDGEGAAARFNRPSAVVVDKEGTIVVADRGNNLLRRMTGRHMATLADGSEVGTADGAGPGACFTKPFRLALDERGRLLVARSSDGRTRCGWWRRRLRRHRGWVWWRRSTKRKRR
jgi:hypothetical protein